MNLTLFAEVTPVIVATFSAVIAAVLAVVLVKLLDHLRHASEVFLTNSVSGVTPLLSIDEVDIAGGGKGQLARSLQTGMHSHWNEIG